jgi:hypothetical protein
MMKSVLGRGLFLLFSLILSQLANAQVDWNKLPETVIGDEEEEVSRANVVITGTVTSEATKEGIVGASVSVDIFKHFDYTDSRGKFALSLPPGRYKLIIRHVGMLPAYYNLNVYSAGVLDVKMIEGVVNLDEVVVSARPLDANVKQTIAGVSKLSVAEIRTMPTFMGELDIIKSIQTLPGVTSVGEGSSGFNVRGGRTDQNLVLWDGIPLFNTSHALGFVPGFNQDVVNNFTLYKGNVPATLGGRASSVLEVTSRQGDFSDWKFRGGVGPMSARFLAEGPIIKDKTSMLIGSRTSYSDWVLRRVSNPDVNQSSLFFYDTNIGLSHRIGQNAIVLWSTYLSKDYFKFSDRFAFDWQNYASSLEIRTRTDKRFSPTYSAAYGQYRSNLINPTGPDASQLANRTNFMKAKAVLNFEPNEQHTMAGGVEANFYLPGDEKSSSYNGSSVVPEQVPRNKGLEGALFLNDEYKITNTISLSAGLRYSMYGQLGAAEVYTYSDAQPKQPGTILDTTRYAKGELIEFYHGLEPRLSARVELTPVQSIKFGYNRMRQYIHQISNTTAPTPVDLWQVSSKYLPPQVADNYSVGYFLNLNENMWETSAELFYKRMDNLVEYKDFAQLYINPTIETELLVGKGKAYGGELYVRKLKGFWKGWLSYTYSQTLVSVPTDFAETAINDGEWYPSNYNKPHNLNLVVTRQGNHKNGAVSFIFAYNTGRPFTALETSYVVGSAVIPVYSDRNKYKIPDYWRFDVSFTFGNIIERIDDSLVFSIYNLIGRENAYSVFYQRPANVFVPRPYKLSVLGAAMPSLTYNFNF